MKYILLSLFVSLSLSALAQKDTPFEKEFFKDDKTGLRNAIKAIEDADETINQSIGSEGYALALPLYLEAYKFNPNNAALNFKIGMCMMKGLGLDKKEAILYFKKSYLLDPNYNVKDIHFLMGRAHHYHGDWEDAIKEYELALKKGDLTQAKIIKKHIQECKNGIELSKKPVRAFIENISPLINTKDPEYGPVITADESMLFFTSRRADTQGGNRDTDGQFFEDVYLSEKKDGQWTAPKNVGRPINSSKHDATIGLSADGSILFVYEEGEIFECDFKDGVWSKPEKLNKNINTKHKESAASISSDGKRLYFVSYNPEGSLGGGDIYYSEKTEKGEWGKAVNLGPTINTEYDEEGVFIHPDGKTLYFSSKGHDNIGGFDVFISKFENGKWTKPVNMGFPINSPDDDVYLVVNANGRRAYYASTKSDTRGLEDIYVVTILGEEKPLALKTEDNLFSGTSATISEKVEIKAAEISKSNLTLFKGTVLDSLSRKPLAASITITDNEKNETIFEKKSDAVSGKFLVTLPAGKNYGISVKADGFLFHSENFDLPEGGDFLEVNKTVLLKKIEVGNTVVLRNIFFDTDKATLRSESFAELETLLKLLKDNASLRIEISGHTDNQGGAEYNLGLSERRAKAVLDYLTGKGIVASRLESKGYGLTKPLAPNTTPAGRQLNRRTEFKILSK
jgi:flagellar motor protein MotB